MKFQDYLNLKESRIYEFSGDDAVSTGVGSGGEIDDLLLGLGAAVAVLGKSIYNGVVYAGLKKELKNYLENYKKYEVKKARDVFDYEGSKKMRELESKLESLEGTKEEDGRGRDPVVVQKIKDVMRARIEQASGDQKSQLRDKRDEAIDKVRLQIQELKDAIKKEEDSLDVEWDKEQEKWRLYDEKFDERQDGFIEVRDSVLASSWKKKWENEFTIAKNQAEIEVLDKVLEIARAQDNQKAVEEITGAKKRREQREKKAQDELDAVLDDAEKAEVQQASAQELGIVDMLAALTQHNANLQQTYSKWRNRAEEEGAEDQGGGRDTKASLESKIQKAESKIQKAEAAIGKLRNSGDNEKASKVEAAVQKLKKDVGSYKEELGKLKESFDFSLMVRINETLLMIDQLLESVSLLEKEEKNLTLTDVRTIISKSISDAPEDQKKSLASEGYKDLQDLKSSWMEYVEARNFVNQKFQERAEENPDDREALPKGMSEFSKISALDADQEEKKYQEAVDSIRDEYKVSSEEPEEKPEEQPEEEPEEDQGPEEEEGDTQEIKDQKKKIRDLEAEIKELKKTLDTANAAKDKKSAESAEILARVIPNKEKSLEREKKKLEELTSAQESSVYEKSLSFQSYMKIKQKNGLQNF